LLFTLLTALALTASPPGAEAPQLYFEQTTVTLQGGKPAGPGVLTRVWYAGKKMRLQAGDAPSGPALILRLDRGKAYRLDPREKVSLELDLARLRESSQADLAMAGEIMGAREEGAARTSSLAAARTIAGHACREYRITAGAAVMDLCLTDELPMGVDAFADFLEWSGASQSMAGLLAELRKLAGFPLRTRSRVTVLGDVQETVSTVTKVRVGPCPAALFEPPKDYRVRREPAAEDQP